MKVTTKLKQGRCVTIKIMRVHFGMRPFPTSLWFSILVFAHRARSRKNCGTTTRLIIGWLIDQPLSIALWLPRSYILVHNRNRIENAPYNFVILLYLTTLNNILLNETLHSRLNINCAGENVITTTKNGGHYERRAAVGRRNTPLNSNVAVSSAQKTSACLRK